MALARRSRAAASAGPGAGTRDDLCVSCAAVVRVTRRTPCLCLGLACQQRKKWSRSEYFKGKNVGNAAALLLLGFRAGSGPPCPRAEEGPYGFGVARRGLWLEKGCVEQRGCGSAAGERPAKVCGSHPGHEKHQRPLRVPPSLHPAELVVPPAPAVPSAAGAPPNSWCRQPHWCHQPWWCHQPHCYHQIQHYYQLHWCHQPQQCHHSQ